MLGKVRDFVLMLLLWVAHVLMCATVLRPAKRPKKRSGA